MNILSKEFVRRFLLNYFECEPDFMILIKDYINDSDYLKFKEGTDSILTYECEYNIFEGHLYTMRRGATKIAFVFDEFDEVIKIPFNGELVVVDTEEEEEKEIYEEFRNHIESENKIYDESPFKEILLRNEFFMNFGGVKVYTQKRIDTTYDDKYMDGRASKEAWKKLPKEIRTKVNAALTKRSENEFLSARVPDKKFLADIIEFYDNGVQMVEEMNFLDMHTNNYGYIGNRPIIFDYSGYSDKTDSEDYMYDFGD